MADIGPLSNRQRGGGPSRWDVGLAALICFVEREGHALVPQAHREDGYPLGQWVAAQRQAQRWGTLGACRADTLAALPGWSWHATRTRWQTGLNAVSVFANREGHARVPVRHIEDGFALGRWVSKQRIAYRQGRINSTRVAALEAVAGWTWDARASK